MSLHAALLALQEKDANGNRLGWRTGTTEHALINTETTSVAVLALGANASWVLEPGLVPLRSAPGNYIHEHEMLSAVAGRSVPGYIVFGPSWALEPGRYGVEFALRSPAARVESPLATIEVYDGSAVVAVKVIEGADAPIGNQWHRYRLAAEVGNASNLAEFRVFWHGAYDLDVGSIRVTQQAVTARLPAVAALSPAPLQPRASPKLGRTPPKARARLPRLTGFSAIETYVKYLR